MKFASISIPDTNTLCLSGEMDIYQVEPARHALLDHLATHPGIELDLSGVETCDAAGLQLLLAAGRSAGAAGKTFSIKTTVPAVEQCRVELGLEPEKPSATAP